MYRKSVEMNYNEKQIQIITTAESLFASKGFDGTSVRDIAEAAGINIAMISYYFGSKEKLMEALFDLRTGHVILRTESVLKDDSLSPFDKLKVLIDAHINKSFELHLFHKIMVTEQLLNKNVMITNALADLKKRNIEIVSQLVRDGQLKGVFKEDIDVALMMYTLIGTVTHTVMNRSFYRELNQKNDMPDEAFTAYLKEKLSTHILQIFKATLSK